MSDKHKQLLEEAMPLFNINDGEMRQAIAQFHTNEGIDKNEGLNPEVESESRNPLASSQGYRSKWTTSRANDNDDDIEDEDDDDSTASTVDISLDDYQDLPVFADDECKELSRRIKMLERKRDEAKKNTKEHVDRVALMKDHLHNVRQEIEHSNGLLAAKHKEIETDKHLIALEEREKVAVLLEIKEAGEAIKDEKELIRSLESQTYVANEELEKLKLSLNWNQEELEQWATAAAKKESDNLALEKFKRADEVKIKELTLKLETMTKISVEKQAELENEATETQSKQLEIGRLTRTFKADHEERRQLVEQWQKTVQAMKDRDEEINRISSKYTEVTEVLNLQTQKVSMKREEIFGLKVRLWLICADTCSSFYMSFQLHPTNVFVCTRIGARGRTESRD